MKEKICKLIDVKSIITLLLTGVFAVQVFRGSISDQNFFSVFLMIISFYFGTQYQKNSEGK